MFQVLLPRELAALRGEFIKRMREVGIVVGVHYPAIHLTTLYSKRCPSQLPHTEDVAARILTLPLFPAMQEKDVQRVALTLTEVLASFSAEGDKA